MATLRSLLALSISFACAEAGKATEIYRHGWDTVADVMGMHGKYSDPDVLPDDKSVAFIAAHYKTVTTGSGCGKSRNITLEDGALDVAARIKAANPDVLVGMYMRTDMQLEVATAGCTFITEELTAAGSAYSLRDDSGALISKNNNYLWDYTNADARALFTSYLVGVVNRTLVAGHVAAGRPAMDYVYLDGPSWTAVEGISAARNAAIGAAKYGFFTELQATFADLPGGGRNVILNGVDDPGTAAAFSATGAAGVMFDHWSILQYVNRGPGCNDPANTTCGTFNATAMDGAFDLARSAALSNLTLQVKGWVGPVIKQQGHYPPSMHTPATPAEQAAVAAERFNSELALFLLVAEDRTFWLYSWFWGFDSWVPDRSDSQTPHGFYPQAACALGAPGGPPQRVGATWTYTREYAHASVFVDLTNRTASRVDFKGSC